MKTLNSSLFYRMLGILACLVAGASSVATGNQNPSPAAVDEIRKLDFLIGEWKGAGWDLELDGSRTYRFSKTTEVRKESNAKLRIVDETYYGSPGGPSVYSILEATISYDESAKLYHWRAKDSTKGFEAKLLSEKTFQYGMPFSITVKPADGNRKTTIEVKENGEWHETVEVWHKGKWYKSEESILKRVNK